MGIEYEKIDYSGIEFGNWYEQPWEDLRPGITRVVFGMSAKTKTCTIGSIDPDHARKPHSHPNEQIAFFIQGTCDYYVDGKPVRCKPGSWIVIPPNVEHYIHVFNTEEPVLNIDVFTPPRPEYTESYTNFVKGLEK